MKEKIKNFLSGNENKKELKRYQKKVELIDALEPEIEKLTDEQLSQKTEEFKTRLLEGEEMEDILPEAFAVVRETIKRVGDKRLFDVQLIGGIVLHEGKIAEMRTGEGKTHTAVMAVYLNALVGKGVHIVTVNDYLSRRDAVWMGQTYAFLKLSVGVINGENQSYLYDPGHTEKDEERDEEGYFKVVYEFLKPVERKEAYEADITYGTNNEFGFDYLRDNLEYDSSALRQRELNFTIVDEIDSILIDEARTPLIIAAPSEEAENLYIKFASIARQLKKEKDYTVDEKQKAVQVTDDGIEKVENILGIENIYTEKGVKNVHHLETALRAKALFEYDKDYVIKSDEVIIVDEFTGRLQPGRRWSEGLHQAIEAKEGVHIKKESRTFASITFQNYFRLYDKLSGMTGTAATSSEEFFEVYGLKIILVPTHLPNQREDRNDQIFQTEIGKFKAIAREVKKLYKRGQPVLIGTVSIEKNEDLSTFLKKEGVPHEILNAKNHEHEGEIIAKAGGKGKVTIATNMAGRGVDIKLGGKQPTTEEYEEVKKIGGLFVLGTERHEARRIDNQLRGRSARQGDPGGTCFFVSLEDSLMRVFAPDYVKNMMGRFGISEDQPIENKMISRALESAQTKIEGFNFDARKNVLSFDNVLNYQRQGIYRRRDKVLKGSKEDVKQELYSIVADDEELIKTIEQKKEEMGENDFFEVIRRLILQSIDMFWVEHLEVMDYMRSSVNLRAYGQRDPLVEYKKEGLRLFRETQEAINDNILKMIPKIDTGAFKRDKEEREKLKEVHNDVKTLEGDYNENENKVVVNSNKEGGYKPQKNVGRNDPCPCGSGKKYKRCCGK